MSESLTAKVLIVGGGPGGYVAAIRAGQLGLDTVLVEADRLGGTCLIRGCIPSKALIHAASTYAALADEHTARMGIMAGESWIDMAQTVRWKDSVVDKLNGGVGALLKRAQGARRRRLGDLPGRQDLHGRDGRRRRHHHRRARDPGERLRAHRAVVPALRRDGDLLDRGALPDRAPQASGGGRRGLYRPGAWIGVPQAGLARHRRRSHRDHPAPLRS